MEKWKLWINWVLIWKIWTLDEYTLPKGKCLSQSFHRNMRADRRVVSSVSLVTLCCFNFCSKFWSEMMKIRTAGIIQFTIFYNFLCITTEKIKRTVDKITLGVVIGVDEHLLCMWLVWVRSLYSHLVPWAPPEVSPEYHYVWPKNKIKI